MWSWVLTCVGVTGLFLIGKHKWYGFLIGGLNECLWVVYAFSTKQYGFIVGALLYGTVHLRSGLSWFRRSHN